jgi:PKD repeat protein
MRSIPLLAATVVILTGAWACGGNGGVEPNSDPDANFTFTPCTVGVACTFTDVSTDPDGNNTITGRRWNFGDGSADVIDQVTTPHIFGEAKDYTVTLTVTDNGGKSNAQATTVTVTGGTPTNQPPAASFTYLCTGTTCAFTNTSTDIDGQVVASTWNFGDGTATSPEPNPTHVYNVTAPTTFNVVLTVTDNLGAIGTITQAVAVTPSQSVQCTAGTVDVDCALSITQRSTVKLALTQLSCELNNRITVRPPYAQTAFFNVCFQPVGAEYTLKAVGGLPQIFEAGTQVVLRFTRGEPDIGGGDPPAGPPAARVDGGFPNWTVSVDDGGNTGGVGEPDYADVIFTVVATPQ